MLNSIILMGRLVADPELKSTASGTSVCSFRIAVDRDGSGRNGAEKQTDFIDIVTWRQTAEFVSRYFSKGKMIIVQGSLQGRKWQDKEGNNRISWEVQANNVWFGESKNDEQTAAPREEKVSAPAALPPAASESYSSGGAGEFTAMPDEDLPF